MSNNKFEFVLKEKNDLPFSYNETKIVILPKDTDTIFMYWDLSEETLSYLKQNNLTIHPSIRLRTLENCHFYYINPTQNTREWYFNLKHTCLVKNNLVADLGIYDSNGNFCVLCSSQETSVPSGSQNKKDYDYWKKMIERGQSGISFDELFNLHMNSSEFFIEK